MSFWNKAADLVSPYHEDEPEHVQHCREAAEYFTREGYAMWHVMVITAWLVAENEYFDRQR